MSKKGALITCLVAFVFALVTMGLSKFCMVADWFQQQQFELCQLPLQMLAGLAIFYALVALVVVVYNEK